ncbi:MAG: CBS domain-containing protein [Patescibacteria group bacterium]|nr:CBS domain-containing protein [Patescibacteria group bacterium]
MKNLKIKDIVEKNVPSGGEDILLKDALKLMIKKKINIFIVLDSNKKIKGVFTLYDLLDKIIPFFVKLDTTLGYISTNEIISEDKILKLSNIKVKDIMIQKVYTLKENEEIIKSIILMYIKNFDYIPVIDNKDNFLGVVNRINVEKKIIDIINSFSKNS